MEEKLFTQSPVLIKQDTPGDERGGVIGNNKELVNSVLTNDSYVNIIKTRCKNIRLNESLTNQIIQLARLIQYQKESELLPSNFDIQIEKLIDNTGQSSEPKLPTLTSFLFSEPLDDENYLRYISTIFVCDEVGDSRCINIILHVGLTSKVNLLSAGYNLHNELIKELGEDNIPNRKRLLLLILNNIYLEYCTSDAEQNVIITSKEKRKIINTAIKDGKKMFGHKIQALRINYKLGGKTIWKGYIASSENPLIQKHLNPNKSSEVLNEGLDFAKKILSNKE